MYRGAQKIAKIEYSTHLCINDVFILAKILDGDGVIRLLPIRLPVQGLDVRPLLPFAQLHQLGTQLSIAHRVEPRRASPHGLVDLAIPGSGLTLDGLDLPQCLVHRADEPQRPRPEREVRHHPVVLAVDIWTVGPRERPPVRSRAVDDGKGESGIGKPLRRRNQRSVQLLEDRIAFLSCMSTCIHACD